MKKTICFAFLMACIILMGLNSCKKEKKPPVQSNQEEVQINKSKKQNNSGLVGARLPSDLSLVPLTKNTDGSWAGILGGISVRFDNFIYEIIYDVNGNPYSPKANQPCWPTSFGSNPPYSTETDFNCLSIIHQPGGSDNQFAVQNLCNFFGSIYSHGAGYNSYIAVTNTNWSNYLLELDIFYQLSAQGAGNYYPPKPPTAPLLTPYLAQDYLPSIMSPVISTCRFGIYSYNSSTGEIIFGYDPR